MALNTCTNSHEMESVIWNFLLKVLQNPSQYTTSLSMQAWHWESTPLSHSNTSPHAILCFSTSPRLALYFFKCYSAGHHHPKCYFSAQGPLVSSHLSWTEIHSPQGPTPVWPSLPLWAPLLPLSFLPMPFKPHWPPWHFSHTPSTFLPQDLGICYYFLGTISLSHAHSLTSFRSWPKHLPLKEAFLDPPP